MLTISNLDPRENRNQTKGPRDGNAWRSVVESISESIQMLFPLGLYVESKKRKRPEICNAWQHKVHHSLLNIDFCFVWQIQDWREFQHQRACVCQRSTIDMLRESHANHWWWITRDQMEASLLSHSFHMTCLKSWERRRAVSPMKG